jgi:hypothetical protein
MIAIQDSSLSSDTITMELSYDSDKRKRLVRIMAGGYMILRSLHVVFTSNQQQCCMMRKKFSDISFNRKIEFLTISTKQ